jgi:hypothetical protein
MKRAFLGVLWGAILASGPAVSVRAAELRSPDAAFEALSQRYLDEFSRFTPIDATHIGDHRYDGQLDNLSAANRELQLNWDRELLSNLKHIERAKLTRANQVDAAMLANSLEFDIWQLNEERPWAWNPLRYNQLAGDALYNLMVRDFAPLPVRLRSATARLKNLHQIFDQEHENLDPKRVPPIYAQLASERNRGLVNLIDEFITPRLNAVQGKDREELTVAISAAKRAVGFEQIWLDTQLIPSAKGDFRVGAKIFDTKLKFTLESKLNRREVRARADTALKRVRAEMYHIARQVLLKSENSPPIPIHPTPDQEQRAIESALAIAQAEHPPRDGVEAFARSALADATDFVRTHNLVTLPKDPIEVVPMAVYRRGFSVADCDAPGPLDVGQKTLYAISPIPRDWDSARVESFLREYSNRGIQDLTTHEAMPGHYVQLTASNRYPSKLRSVLGSGSFIEGWAVYASRMMVDEGYGDALMKLINRKWYLRGVANAILDQAVHVDGMSREAAMHLMVHDTFQEEREAALKWQRAQISSTQLSTYFVGVQEHLDLRREAEQRLGPKFNLKAYHDQALSYGSPPVRFVRALMFDLPIEP